MQQSLRRKIMFLFWIFVAIAFGIAEEIHLEWDAHKNPYQSPECFKPKPWEQKKK